MLFSDVTAVGKYPQGFITQAERKTMLEAALLQQKIHSPFVQHIYGTPLSTGPVPLHYPDLSSSPGFHLSSNLLPNGGQGLL